MCLQLPNEAKLIIAVSQPKKQNSKYYVILYPEVFNGLPLP
ncbi:hypothetical protein N836_29195 [Leptolyngbya sp. Heron Island J]|nr:hypothetical protein N836_29195 [Leptolyngbya sp. Heron Island J]